ncbi:uncharacterized protein N7500_001675 [Penicillium coprophilum]|uniref:uncharacterized protein n=1 Tax=Penicillium coprophilum TaxID=36646 RepID=UPI002397A80F|nr:uncharacterized protein N7500_001675 [Penicillium coprophilum]KAJ5173744.1 hypothetical protein N7500_001675 [Penicillium coprophilum]
MSKARAWAMTRSAVTTTSTAGDSERKLILLETTKEVEAYLRSCPTDQASSARAVVISSYNTWAVRTTTEIDEHGNRTHHPRKATCQETDPMAIDLNSAEADVDEDMSDPDDIVPTSPDNQLPLR